VKVIVLPETANVPVSTVAFAIVAGSAAVRAFAADRRRRRAVGDGSSVTGKPDKSDDRLDDFLPRFRRTDRGRERVATSSLRVARRVAVKAHVQKLGSRGAQAATRHLRYIEREGVEKDGSPGRLYGPEEPAAREVFEQPRPGERHQFRFIVSPEGAHDLDLTSTSGKLMARVERDLGRSIEWAAINHHDTEHPHAHVIVRGVCREVQALVVTSSR
jgi:hypothetical protein